MDDSCEAVILDFKSQGERETDSDEKEVKVKEGGTTTAVSCAIVPFDIWVY